MLDANHRGDVDSSIDVLGRIYDEAVCVGGSVSTWRAHEERLHSAIELLAHTTTHTPYLTLLVLELADASGAGAACLAREARRHAALVIRLAHRALEVHACDLGYEPDAWRERAVLEADAALTAASVEDPDDELGLATAAVVDATIALAATIAAVSRDCMAVPDYMASALAGWLLCYAQADPAGRR
jgi:hypothetical protein